MGLSREEDILQSMIDEKTYPFEPQSRIEKLLLQIATEGLGGWDIEVVDTLPENGEEHVIYLLPLQRSKTGNMFEEYIWVNSKWELLGTATVDLSNYYTKAEVDSLIPDTSTFASKEDLLKSILSVTTKATSITKENDVITKIEVVDSEKQYTSVSTFGYDGDVRVITEVIRSSDVSNPFTITKTTRATPSYITESYQMT